MSNSSIPWVEGDVGGITIACQGFLVHSNFLGGVIRSISSGVLFDIGIFLVMYRCVRLLLKPLGMRYVAQLLAGFIVGPFFGIYVDKYSINRPSLYIMASILSHIGFFLHLFMLGVEINLSKLTKTGKKAFIISFSGLFTSLLFSCGIYSSIKDSLSKNFNLRGLPAILIYSASNYLMSTTSHLNDLGISNSKVGQLASSASMVIDMTVMLTTIILMNVIGPLLEGGRNALRCLLVFYYALMFFVFRPMIIYIISLKPEGRPMKQIHFVMIVVSVLILALMGESFDQKFSPFLLALTLPEEPLASIFAERLDPFTSGVLFPFFVITRGMQMELRYFDDSSLAVVIILAMGYIGKFFGTIVSGRILRLPFSQAITIALIMSARGVLDIASLQGLLQRELLNYNQYTLCIIFSSITMGVLLPCAKFFYEPSRQYSTIMRHSVMDFQANNEVLLILVCIHKEDNISGFMRILKVCHSTPENPISLIALQLLQLTGRCTMPIMAPLHEVSSISSLRSNIERCTRIVNSFLHLERETEGRTRTQHFVAMSPYMTMHNDICNLAYEKTVGLVILPFHASWAGNKTVKDSSLSIREVNNMVLKKAPCSVGILIDRSGSQKRIVDDVYLISIIFIGGADDYEALAYSKLFANHPSVKLNVIWLKAAKSEAKNNPDYEIMKKFHRSCKSNVRISFDEVIVNNGAETVQVLVSTKEKVDLVITGKYHNLQCIPMLGLSAGWSEYPELGVLGDIFASSDFEFSLLIVQQEPQNDFAHDFDEK